MPTAVPAQNLSSLAELPDYRRFDTYQGTITREEFTHLLETLYAPHGGWQAFIRVDADGAVIRKTSIPLDDCTPCGSPRPTPTGSRAVHLLATSGRIAARPAAAGGQAADRAARGARSRPPRRPVGAAGGTLVLHRGRRTGDGRRDDVAGRSGARRPAPNIGATVELVRDSEEPSTPLRPADLVEAARRQLAEAGVEHPHETSSGAADPERQFSVPWTSDMLFTRADIRARGRRVNETLKPDLTVCLHFNAEAWGDPAHPALVEKNHLHVLVNGCYGPDEIAKDDVRFEMLTKLLNRSGAEELAAAEPVAAALAAATGLAPYQYTGQNAVRVGGNPHVWARNLLANRIYECPVVYAEPYVMNSPEVFARVQAGDYEGTRDFGGLQRRSIFREYADAVAEGLVPVARGPGMKSCPRPVPVPNMPAHEHCRRPGRAGTFARVA